MFYILFLGAILLTSKTIYLRISGQKKSYILDLVNANVNLTCYECSGCISTPNKTSIGNNLCFVYI